MVALRQLRLLRSNLARGDVSPILSRCASTVVIGGCACTPDLPPERQRWLPSPEQLIPAVRDQRAATL
jgi:hypothetical protein